MTIMDANDVERITEIAQANTNADAIFTWGYDKGERAKLDKLYEKGKTSQWNV
ncbi:MAG: hypothetical protein P8J50_12030 [Acidimicrobiales bacterium]|jgi:hypothetical protein|nr:hypothetical protein [Acidimicrobiales bacterium]